MTHSSSPLISVIIPAFNAEKYIESAINSIRSQSVKEIEIMVVNDGSSDNTRAIVEDIARLDPRVKLINQANSGKPSIARNVGISNTSGKYIAFMDADDIILPGKLEAQLALFNKLSNISLIFHDWMNIKPDNDLISSSHLKSIKFLEKAAPYLNFIQKGIYVTKDNYYNFASTVTLGILTITVMLKREILNHEDEWFPEDLDIGEDLDLWYRLLMKHRAAFIDEAYCQYRKHPDSITQNSERMILGLITAQKRNLIRAKNRLTKKEIKLIKHQLSYKHRNLGYLYYKNEKRLLAINCYKESFFLRPGAKQILSLLKVLIPCITISRQSE